MTVLAIGSVGFKVRIPTYEPVPCQRTDFFSYFDKLIISTFIVHTSIYFLHSENISLHLFISSTFNFSRSPLTILLTSYCEPSHSRIDITRSIYALRVRAYEVRGTCMRNFFLSLFLFSHVRRSRKRYQGDQDYLISHFDTDINL